MRDLFSGFNLENIVFSDESRVCLGPDNGLLWRRYGQYDENIFIEEGQFPPGLLIFGSIGKGYKGRLQIIQGNVDAKKYCAILTDSGVLEDIARMSESQPVVFMQDGARCHTAFKAMTFIRQKVKVISEWPPNSPDLNPIEMLWSILKYTVKSRSPKNLQELEEAIEFAWSSLKQETIDALVSSFRDRLLLVLENEGKSITDLLRRNIKPKMELSAIQHDAEVFDSWYHEVDPNILDDVEKYPGDVSAEQWSSWSEGKWSQYTKYVKNANSYFYREVAPGEHFITGPFSAAEHAIFLERVKELKGRLVGNWGIFSRALPGRVGYQCANYYRQLVKRGILEDETKKNREGKVLVAEKSQNIANPINGSQS